MTPEQAAHDTQRSVVDLPARFMTNAATFARGAELGFEGFDFYAAGRAGVLGDVPADVVVAALVYFEPQLLHDAWERSGKVMTRRAAAEEWNACGHAYARDQLPSSADDARLGELLGRIEDSASPVLAPVFSGYRVLPEPADPKELVYHRLYALRELRGAMHAAAVLTVGLTPQQALAVRTPQIASVFGWQTPLPEPDAFKERWMLAEARTDRMLGRHYAVLDADECAELVELLRSIAP
jgi:hypothetical protein